MTEVYNTASSSKYIYTLNEQDTQMFVFEIILKKINQKNKIIRKIKKTKQGSLITFDENIVFSEINKIELTAININDPTNEITVNLSLDQNKKFSTYIDSKIYLEFYATIDKLEANFNILN